MKNLLFVCLTFLSAKAFATGATDACFQYVSSVQAMQVALDARGASKVNKAFLMSQYSRTLWDLRDQCFETEIENISPSDCEVQKTIESRIELRESHGEITKLNADFLRAQLNLAHCE